MRKKKEKLIIRTEAQKLLNIENRSTFNLKLLIAGIKPNKMEMRNGRCYSLYKEKDILRLKRKLAKKSI